MKRILTKNYIVVFNNDTKEIILKGVAGNTVNTPHTVVEFETEEKMNGYIIANNLKEPEE